MALYLLQQKRSPRELGHDVTYGLVLRDADERAARYLARSYVKENGLMCDKPGDWVDSGKVSCVELEPHGPHGVILADQTEG